MNKTEQKEMNEYNSLVDKKEVVQDGVVQLSKRELQNKIICTFGTMNEYMKFCEDWCTYTTLCNKQSVNREKLKRWNKK